jgi:hypothetical protein
VGLLLEMRHGATPPCACERSAASPTWRRPYSPPRLLGAATGSATTSVLRSPSVSWPPRSDSRPVESSANVSDRLPQRVAERASRPTASNELGPTRWTGPDESTIVRRDPPQRTAWPGPALGKGLLIRRFSFESRDRTRQIPGRWRFSEPRKPASPHARAGPRPRRHPGRARTRYRGLGGVKVGTVKRAGS